MQPPFIKTLVGVVKIRRDRQYRYFVRNMQDEHIGTIERLDNGRWIIHPDRTRTHRTVGQAVTALQRAVQ